MKTSLVREERGTAIAVGALYVLATAAGVAAAIVGAPTEVDAMAARSGAVLVGALLVTVMAVAVAGVGVVFYPVLARDAGAHTWHGAALGFAGARIAEGAIFLVSVAATLAMLGLGEAMLAADGVRAVALEAAGFALETFSEYAMVAAQTAFCVGAALLYVLLYRSRRMPRWLSVGPRRDADDVGSGLHGAVQRRHELDAGDDLVRTDGGAGDGPRRVAARVRVAPRGGRAGGVGVTRTTRTRGVLLLGASGRATWPPAPKRRRRCPGGPDGREARPYARSWSRCAASSRR